VLSRNPSSTSRSSAEPKGSSYPLATIVEELARMTNKHLLTRWKVALVHHTAPGLKRPRNQVWKGCGTLSSSRIGQQGSPYTRKRIDTTDS